ncbi:CPBP family intramembrane metalloprotease [Nocardioides mangrovicus]|uniref:CPBP family intramembrane metalloprotease n=1 Tax=Nocardioides mangrovicus TaxID=2478913 RepID=A0A3L8NZD0_9ACTN|nr:CPBP family intramembrane glutamic endopeptidase [Nocardioides mangrovicus]RLV48141.1 CPBP family intramembrane metalloprotease [Nocardioides mangrovicus]
MPAPSLWQRLLGPSLTRQVPRDHRQSSAAFRRRQLVTLGFVVLGAGVLAWSLRITPGSNTFYLATILLAMVWAVGGFASGPLHLGRIDTGVSGPEHGTAAGTDDGRDAGPLGRPVVQPLLLGLGLAAVFVVGGLAVHALPFLGFLDDAVARVLAYADRGSTPLLLAVTVVNGVAEEIFFRGAVYAAIPRRPVVWTTLVYVVATLATGNVMLGFAAIVVGAVVALQRRASGGVLAPIITHITWSVVMLYALPAIFVR